jgi:hypothetical protein
MELFSSLTVFRSLQVTPIVCSGVSESLLEGEPATIARRARAAMWLERSPGPAR